VVNKPNDRPNWFTLEKETEIRKQNFKIVTKLNK